MTCANANFHVTSTDYYFAHEYTHNLIQGVPFSDGFVYALFIEVNSSEVLMSITEVDKGSRNSGRALRVARRISTLRELKSRAVRVERVCTKEELEELFHEYKSNPELPNYNRGQLFEKLVCERVFHQTWTCADEGNFTVAPDIVDASGSSYQVKYLRGSYVTEEFMNSH